MKHTVKHLEIDVEKKQITQIRMRKARQIPIRLQHTVAKEMKKFIN